MSLIKVCIQRPGNGLHQQDLLRLARHLALAPTQGIKLDSAMFTKLCMPGFALRSKANNTLYASLGNYVWSAMVWSTRIISTEPDAWTFQLHHKGRPFEGPAMSLIKACIQRPANGLHQQDLLRLDRKSVV